MSRRSTFAVSTFTPALNVLSKVLPESTFFSLVRTNAPPLPGFTCWKSRTVHSWPSRFSTMPFLRSFVVATASLPMRSGVDDLQALRCRREHLCLRRVPNDEGVLDSDTTAARKVHTRLDGGGHAIGQSTRRGVPERGRLVDLEPHAVAGPVAERLAVAGGGDVLPSGSIDREAVGTGKQCLCAAVLCLGNQLVDLLLPLGRGGPDHDGSGAVGVIAPVGGTEVDLQQVAGRDDPGAGRVVRDGAVRSGSDDGLEGQPVGAELEHPPFEVTCDVLLGAAEQTTGFIQVLQRPARDRAGLGEAVDLALVLHGTDVFDHPTEMHGLDPVARLLDLGGENLVAGEGHVMGFEG